MSDHPNSRPLVDTIVVRHGATSVVAGNIENVTLGSGQPRTPLGPFATVPPLPPAFLDRPEYSEPLIEKLLSCSVTLGVTAIEGMGGVGKTTMALALCHDVRARAAFADGIVWLTIGKEADLHIKGYLEDALAALNQDFAVGSEAAYRSSFKDKAVLVVLDDVWSTAAVEPFILGSGRSRLLYTSRDKSIAGALSATEHEVGVLDDAQAYRFLRRWSGRDGTTLPEPYATYILSECKGLVLGLAMVGAALKGQPDSEWADIAADLKDARLKTVGTRPGGYAYQTLHASIAVGVDALDEVVRSRYLSLAVLLEDMSASETLLRSLWGVDERETRRTARILVDRCLARRDAKSNIRIHDFQLDYIRGEHPNKAALALEHSALRQSLHVVNSYPGEYATQMIWRLLSHAKEPIIATVLARLKTFSPRPRLMPRWATALPVGGPASQIFETAGVWIRAVAISADGRRAISGSEDNLLRVWNLLGSETPRTLSGHTAEVRAVALSADGNVAASGSEDKTVRIWDLTGAQPPVVLTGHTSAVRGLAMSADGLRVVSGSRDRTLRFWNLQTSQDPQILFGHADDVHAVAISADGRLAVSGSQDQTVRVWRLSGNFPHAILIGHTERIYGVAISAHGERAVSASDDGTVRVWDLRSNRCVHILEGHSAPVTAVALSATGQQAISGSRDKTLREWSIGGELPPRILQGHTNFVNAVALSADGQTAVSSSLDKTLRVWNLSDERLTDVQDGLPHQVKSVAISGDATSAVSGSSDKSLRLWSNIADQAPIVLEEQLGKMAAVSLSWDGKRLATGAKDAIKIWNVPGNSVVLSLPSEGGQVTALALSGDGKTLVSGSRTQALSIWNLQTEPLARIVKLRVGGIKCLAISRDGQRFALGGGNRAVHIWNSESESAILILKGHINEVRSIAMSSDGRQVASGSLDHSVRFWNLDDSRSGRVLTGHRGPVHAVSMSRDGRRIASGSSDKTVRIWNPYTGRCLATFHCDAEVFSCAWADDKIIAGDGRGKVHLFAWEE